MSFLSPAWGSERPQGEMNFPGLGCLLSSFGKSRQEQGVSQHTITAEPPPHYRCPVRPNIRGYFDQYWFTLEPVLVTMRSTTGYYCEPLLVHSLTSTGPIFHLLQHWI